MTKDELIIKLGDELLRMSRHLSKLAEKKMPHDSRESEDDFGDAKPSMPVREVFTRQPAPPKVLDIVPPLSIQQAVNVLILATGDNPDRDGLKETPARFAKMWDEMTSGNRVDVKALFKIFESDYADEMIIVKDITFTSFCEHHLLPFYGTADFAYVPSGRKIIGLSKIARLVDAFAKRLQVQERLTAQITQTFKEHMPSTLGVACRIKARHMCMCARGVKQPHAEMITTSLTGVFRDKPEARAEFFSCVGGS